MDKDIRSTWMHTKKVNLQKAEKKKKQKNPENNERATLINFWILGGPKDEWKDLNVFAFGDIKELHG